MATIGDTAFYVRSKNAGPFWVTIDIFCDIQEKFDIFHESKKITPEAIAQVYGVDPAHLKIFYLPELKVIKISYPRPCPQGGRYERDMHSGQQYVQILDLEI
ncbi:DUF4387 domain-containing protein [Clostridium sp. JS66]|uniref:DUF4387 domain-containing protein n=1 Tax=Clostridium sp. JS66 TaxID=3064705 RepID=UPI00298D8902|nr:DUF4387 domain-containing protein [Clostridium sp. JS66]WPC41248.1 DUF4387 domain-containing protein [Clostridium sp. JS66]